MRTRRSEARWPQVAAVSRRFASAWARRTSSAVTFRPAAAPQRQGWSRYSEKKKTAAPRGPKNRMIQSQLPAWPRRTASTAIQTVKAESRR